MSGNSLYVIRFGQRLHKVGFSVDPIGRLAQLRCAEGGSPSVVRTWLRPLGDAEVVERQAHRLLAEWRAWGERFHVGAAAACAAVELAIALVEDTEHPTPLGLPPSAQAAISASAGLPAVIGVIGYAVLHPEIDPGEAFTALRKEGAPADWIFFDYPGDARPALLMAIKAAREGDVLAVLPGQISAEDADRIAGKGATMRVLA